MEHKLSGMDQIIEKKRWTVKRILAIVFSVALLSLVAGQIIWGDYRSKMTVDRQRVTIAEVETGDFLDYISITGTVQPLRTVYLDAIEGGRVEEVLIEEGNMVRKGDVILRLSNTNLHLSIMNREADLAEQMNTLRDTRLLMQKNQLDLQSQLLDLDHSIELETRRFRQAETLFNQNVIPEDEYLDIKESYQYLLSKRKLVLQTQRQDSLFRAVQVEQLEASVERMQQTLALVRRKVENLDVRAPVPGQLASLNAEIGEAKSAGQRLGQIHILDDFKLEADIDEHYISRVSRGLRAEFEFTGQTWELQMRKVYPEVRNGRFLVDFEFDDKRPERLRIGQTFRVRLELGEPKQALLLPRGGFFQKTGGQWIFVITPEGDRAVRRDIQLGSMNPKFYEVLGGLEAGEKVIVSGYDQFDQTEVLILEQ